MLMENWGIKKSLRLVQVMIFFILSISLGCMLLAYNQVQKSYDNLLNRYDHLNRVFIYNDRLSAALYEYHITPTASHLDMYNSGKKEVLELLDIMVDSAIMQRTSVYLYGLRNMFNRFFSQADEMIRFTQEKNRGIASQKYDNAIFTSYLISSVVMRYNSLYTNEYKTYVDMTTRKNANFYIFLTTMQILIIIIAIFIIVHVAKNIQLRVSELVNYAENISQGNYASIQTKIFDAENEYGHLGRAMQSMANNIEYYINEMADKNRLAVKMAIIENENLRMINNMREEELKALYSQINPHFIYNTLNVISQLSYLEGANQTTEMIEAFVDFMRYNTKNISTISDLKGEIEFVKNYMYISKRRYGDRIKFILNTQEGLPNIKIPAIIIQPLVGNAIVHGLKDCTSDGVVDVSIIFENNVLYITVEDNGSGITYDDMEIILGDGQFEDNQHIGLRNVQRRLELFFGQNAVMVINSTENCGTVVMIKIMNIKNPEIQQPA